MAYNSEAPAGEALYVRQVSLTAPPEPGSYLNVLPVVKHLMDQPLRFRVPVTFFVGENGAGKSTLVEAIAIALGFNPEGGTKNFRFSTENSHSELHSLLRVARGPCRCRDGFFLRAESFYNVATHIERMDQEGGLGAPVINSYGGVSLHRQSHGESFLSLVENRFVGDGLYILDEPEAALSPVGVLRLMYNMRRLVDLRSQFIISTHSPLLMAFPDAEIYQITPESTGLVPWRETEHVQLTKQFLESPERMLRSLFRPED